MAVDETTTVITDRTGAKEEEAPVATAAPLSQMLTRRIAARPRPTASDLTARPAVLHRFVTDGKSETGIGTATANGTVSVIATGTGNVVPVLSATMTVSVGIVKTSVNDCTALVVIRVAVETSSTTVTRAARPVPMNVGAGVTVTRKVSPAVP